MSLTLRISVFFLLLAVPSLAQPQPQQAWSGHRRGGAGTVAKIPTKNLKVEKIKSKDGQTGWKVTIPGRRALATPAVVDGMVFVGGGFGSHEFYAFDATSGKARWAIKVSDDGPTAAVVAEGVVAFNTESCTLFVVEAKTGKMLWSKWLGDPLMSQPAIADGKVFMAFPAAGGTWRERPAPYLSKEVQSKTSYNKAQKADDASVGFSTGPASAKLHAAHSNVGQGTVRGLWEFQGSRPCVSDGVLYLTQGNQVVAMNPDDGKEIWARDLKGDLKKIGGHLAAPPSPAGDKLYLATATGHVLILSKKDGAVFGSVDIKAPIRFQPSLADGRLYIGTTNGQLIALDTGDSKARGWPMWGGGPTHNGS